MANTNLISIQLTDHKGDIGNSLAFLPTGATLAQIQTFADALMAALDAVTGAQITGAGVSYQLTLPGGLKGAATANVDQEVGANFGFDCANTPYRHTVRVPAILPTLRTGEDVVTSSGAGQTFANFYINGDGVLFPSDRFANDIAALIGARVTFRKD